MLALTPCERTLCLFWTRLSLVCDGYCGQFVGEHFTVSRRPYVARRRRSSAEVPQSEDTMEPRPNSDGESDERSSSLAAPRTRSTTCAGQRGALKVSTGSAP